jgi:hypothetical protein
MKISPSSRICTHAGLLAPLSTNCGSAAAKNTAVLAFVTPTRNPCRTVFRPLAGLTSPANAAANDFRDRNAWTPR